jgi:signal transduction histidine kinase
VPVFYDRIVRGEPVRMAAIAAPFADGPALIMVAETLGKRERMVRQLLASSAARARVLPLALAVVWYGARRAARGPARELAGAQRLRPVAEDRPRSVRPLVQALNDLLRRLGESIDAQQRFVADAAPARRTPLAALQAQVDAAREPMPPELAATVDHLRAAAPRGASFPAAPDAGCGRASAERPFAPGADRSCRCHAGAASRTGRRSPTRRPSTPGSISSRRPSRANLACSASSRRTWSTTRFTRRAAAK